MKKLVSLLLVLAMLLSLSCTAFASKSFEFKDYTPNDWYYRYVEKATSNGWMNGVGEGSFSPNSTLSRAMFVTILYRMAGEPAPAAAETAFADVVSGSWYEAAVKWAAADGVVNGYTNGTFGVNDPLTREQMVTILYRYAQKLGRDVSVGENTNILSYTDALDISEYAVAAFQWACGAGVVTGSGESLMPKGTSTRAQAAAVLCRFDTAEETAALTRADLEAAIAELGWDYFMKGAKIQYDSQNLTDPILNKYFSGSYRVTEDVAPEYGTSDTTIFSVCSDYVQKVYYNALNERFFGFPLDWVTVCLWLNSESVYGEDIVIARYWDDARIGSDRVGPVLETTPHRMTSAEMREFFQNWKTTMRPGDVLVPNGHAMLYIGNGYVLDCAGGKYNMETGADTYEGNGSVSNLRTVIGCYVDGTDPSTGDAWMFPEGKEANTPTFAVLRPINALVTDDGDGDLSNDKAIDATEITDATLTRLENPAMDINRTVDIGSFGTAVSGGTLTYSVGISNKTNNKSYVTYRQYADPTYAGEDYKGIVVTEVIPEGTELVEGSITEGGTYADGKITWNLDIAAGANIRLSYTVKVTAAAGETITSTGGWVNHIPSNTIANRVGGEKIATGEGSALYEFYHRFNQDWTKTYGLNITDDTSIAEEIYDKVLGKKLELPTAQELFDSIYEQVHVNQGIGLGYNRGNTKEAWLYTPKADAYEKNPMLVRNYLGGMGTWFESDQERINEFSINYLEPGDIVVQLTLSEYKDSEKRTVESAKVMVWLGNGNYAMYDGATGTWSRNRGAKDLWMSFITDAFFVLRPTQLGTLEDSGNAVKPEGELMTQAESKEERQAAVVATAWAFLDKGEKIQHDAAALSKIATSAGGNGRTAVFAAPEDITKDLNWYGSVHGLLLSVFDEALGYRFAANSNAATYNRFNGLLDEYANIYSWTSEDMKAVPKAAEILSLLEPGDIVVATVAKNDYVYGLYLGDGLITDYEIRTSMRYDLKNGVEHVEEGGAARVLKAADVITDQYLSTITSVYVGRFVESPDYDTAYVTPQAKSRVQYPRMVIDRTVNVGPFATVVTGDTLTYTVEITNKGTAAYSGLTVTETVPAGTELKEAAGAKNENGVLTWTLDVPAGQTKAVSYTVTVTGAAGDRIVNDGGFVAAIPSNTISTTVGKDLLNADAQARMTELSGKTAEAIVSELKLDGKKALDAARAAYSYILTGKTDVDTSKLVQNGAEVKKLFTAAGTNSLGLYTMPDAENAPSKDLRAMVVDKYYGGYSVHVDQVLDRLMELRPAHLTPGDILTKVEKEGYIYCIYLGEGKFLQTYSADNSIQIVGEEALESCFKSTNLYFTLTRPSQIASLADLG